MNDIALFCLVLCAHSGLVALMRKAGLVIERKYSRKRGEMAQIVAGAGRRLAFASTFLAIASYSYSTVRMMVGDAPGAIIAISAVFIALWVPTARRDLRRALGKTSRT